MRAVFAGTPAFALPTLRALIAAPRVEVVGVVTQPDRPAGRGMRLTPSPVKQAAQKAGIDLITPERLRGNEEALAWLAAKQPDVLIVVAFGMLLPKEWLEVPRLGAVNVHASLLPRWRGAAPIERAILAGDKETGVSIMKMDEGLDTGCVYATKRLAIDEKTTAGDLRAALAELGAELLLQSLPGIADGSLPCKPQDEAQATYAAKLKPHERDIDWHQSVECIDRIVRAFAPQPAARTRLGDRVIKVLAGEVLSRKGKLAPGEVDGSHGFLDVGCGDKGIYRIHRLQPAGKGPMAAADFLRGLAATTSLRLG